MNLNYRIQSPIGGLMGQPRSSAPERQNEVRDLEFLLSSSRLQLTDLRKGSQYVQIEHDWRIRELQRVQQELPSSPIASPQILERLKAHREQQRVSEVKRKRREEEQRRWKIESTWLAQNRHLYRGQWIALDYDTLLAASFNADEVFDKVRGHVPTPLVVRIEDNELPFGGW